MLKRRESNFQHVSSYHPTYNERWREGGGRFSQTECSSFVREVFIPKARIRRRRGGGMRWRKGRGREGGTRRRRGKRWQKSFRED